MLIRLLKDDAPELIEMGKLHDTIRDLADRIDEDGRDSVASRLTRRICQAAGVSSPMALTADEFNAAAEIFYRERLKREQMGQALDQWSEQVRQLDAMSAWRSGHFNQALFAVLKGRDASAFISYGAIRGHCGRTSPGRRHALDPFDAVDHKPYETAVGIVSVGGMTD